MTSGILSSRIHGWRSFLCAWCTGGAYVQVRSERLKSFFMLGPPGAGKDWQMGLAVVHLGAHSAIGITVSDLIEARFAVDPVAKAKYEALKLRGVNLDDDFVNGVVAERMDAVAPHVQQLYSGAARSVGQAQFLFDRTVAAGFVPVCIEIELPFEIGLERVRLRGRPDDKVLTYTRRYNTFEQYFPQVREYFMGRTDNYFVVSGLGTPEEVFARIVPHLRADVLV